MKLSCSLTQTQNKSVLKEFLKKFHKYFQIYLKNKTIHQNFIINYISAVSILVFIRAGFYVIFNERKNFKTCRKICWSKSGSHHIQTGCLILYNYIETNKLYVLKTSLQLSSGFKIIKIYKNSCLILQ